MEENKKTGYVAGGVFLLVGILILVVGLDQGWNTGKITIIVGAFITLLGGGGIWKPETIGQVIAHYLEKQAGNQKNKISQSQQDSTNSNQIVAKDRSKINIIYSTKGLPVEKTADEKKDLIKEINQDLTKEKLSNILIKCIRLATLTDSDKEKIWLEKEAQGLEGGGREVKKGTLPDYREINAKIRITGKNGGAYETLDCPLGLIHPIFQIEGWIDDYEKDSGAGEMILTAPAPETFKKVHRDVFGKDPPSKDIPFIIPISELKKVSNGLKLRISKFVNNIK